MPAEKKAAGSLTEALAAVQAKLPEIRKTETATVPTKAGGKYSYSYADLAQISKALLPILGAHGLAWVTRPTVTDGRFVLAYELRHTSGDTITGEYPLTAGTPQEIGSAITYARRYCLCSVTGVAPESDDDDAKAASHRPYEPERRQEPEPGPTDAQIEEFDRLRMLLLHVTDLDAWAAAGQQVHAAREAGDVTAEDYVRLVQVGNERRAHLEAWSAKPAAGSAPEGETDA